MKKLILTLFLFPFLFSCTGEKGRSTGGKFASSGKVVNQLLDERFIFNSDSIYKAFDRATNDQKTKSRQLFLKGLDFYVNQHNAAESAKLFRESILYFPDYATYTYLGNAYVDMGDSLRADSALEDHEMPDADRLYASARLAALKKDTSMAISLLTEAFGNGFIGKKKLEEDKIFDFLRASRGFTALVVTYLKDDDKLREILFKSFLASAPELTLPYSFTEDSIALAQTGNIAPQYIDYDFAGFIPGMEDGRFSRDVSNSYYMVGKVKLDNGMYAVMHRVIMMIVDTLAPVEVKLLVYDSTGAVVDERSFAKYTLPETLITGSIDENRVITIRESKMKWKSNPLENGYAGNEYNGADLVSETRYKAGPDGKLVTAQEEVTRK